MKKEEQKKMAPEPIPDDFEINDKQMEQLILDLSNTVYWHAIIKYLDARKNYAENTLYSLDPFKEPTQTARAQGIRSGLMDLPEYVKSLERVRKESEKDKVNL